ncbi:SAF domain-containing protein [Tepidanaerobacter acetatoxydans Re1]|uniref:SAF domain-containing protein n=1 Tax=Tepidanaerobacter acetatoxydans (strain DSM 21804 / JCM 16047 / Re1) TaxID=1209989 RepID=F4LW24_TEPAE|nr:flagellar protein FlgA [Tepidanaerobacter acetatoxydans]AEE91692.1 SAF domain-containing protein [Tepidanaerobacter acetatoxydans Re1]CCP26448.1 SAF domain-containing protein [Tepidanaerobacter acetatoxydans Re1]
MTIFRCIDKFKSKDNVCAAVIGAGHFGTAIVTQQKYVKDLIVPIVADLNLDNAKNALVKAGIPENKIKYVCNTKQAETEISIGNYLYTDKVDIIFNLKAIDIICEATGVPEVGSKHCKTAIEQGKHIALISKELDSVIGPILNKMANEKGLVFTPVDGDQHGLLINMYEWAKGIGLHVISGGKARDAEFVFDEKSKIVSVKADGITVHENAEVKVPDTYMKYFEMIPKGRTEEYLKKRKEILKSLPNAGAFDLCELTIAANATGLKPYTPDLTQGTLRITELPIAYCSKQNNGIYEDQEGIIDVATILRRNDEAGMGGGVFLIVKCDNSYSNYILTTKGQISNYDLNAAIIYRPYHLCGVEVTTSIKQAVQLGISTVSDDYIPRYDLVKKAKRDIKAGEVFGNDHDPKLEAIIVPTTKRASNSSVPGHMLDGNKAKRDIPKDTVITYSMVEQPNNSLLWNLRLQQEEIFD